MASRRPRWSYARRMGKALVSTYKVQGWRQSSGALWVPNQTVRVIDPIIGFDREMLIVEVDYTLDASGTVATLSVSPPEAVLPEPPEPSKPKKAKKARKGGKSDNFEYLLPADWEK